MKAAQINEYGKPDVLKVNTNAEKPTAAQGEVLVAVKAASINPFDAKVLQGAMKDFIPLHFPATLGGDAAGTVAEIGDDVTGFTVGQAVYGNANAVSGKGSFAEFTAVSVTQLAPKPASLDFIQAAALPLVATSAYQALLEHMNLQAGQKILIHGGAGGIGSIAIQIAKQLGAYVAVTASKEDAEFVSDLGAAEVIDYKGEDFSEKLSGYDAVFDTIGGVTNTKSYQVLKTGGVLVSMVESQADEAQSKQYGVTYVYQRSQATTERLEHISQMVESGALKVYIDKVFPLDQAAAAVEYLTSSHPRGKVVLQIAD